MGESPKILIYIYWILIFNLFLFSTACDQNFNENKASQLLEAEVDTLIQHSIDARKTDPLSIISIADSIIQLAAEIGYLEGELGGMYNKAIGHFFQNNYNEVEEWCDSIFKKAIINGPDSLINFKYLGSAHNLNGIIRQKKGEYEPAIQHFLKALIFFESTDDRKSITSVFVNISENFRFMKNFDKALEYNIKAEELIRQSGRYDQLTTVFQNRGNIYNNQGHYEEALEIFKITLDSAKAHNDIDNIVNALNNLGVSYEEMGKDDQALEYYFRALDNYKSRNNYWGEANTLGNISLIYLKRKDFEKAITYCNNALILAQQNGYRELIIFSYENLGEIYEGMGRFKESLGVNKKIGILKDSLYNEEKFRTINSLEQRYKEEKAEKLIIQKDKALIQAQLNSKTLLIFLIVSGVIILFSSIIAFFLFKQVQLKKKNNLELRQKNAIIETKNKEITQQRDEIKEQNEDLELLVNAYETLGTKEIQVGKRKIPINEIVYIKYQNRISHVFLTNGRIIEHRVQLSQLSSELKYKSNFVFAQINQNYIVNFDNVEIDFFDGEDDKFYFTTFLENDHEEGRTEDFVKTRKRSGLNKNFEREFKRYQRLKSFITAS